MISTLYKYTLSTHSINMPYHSSIFPPSIPAPLPSHHLLCRFHRSSRSRVAMAAGDIYEGDKYETRTTSSPCDDDEDEDDDSDNHQHPQHTTTTVETIKGEAPVGNKRAAAGTGTRAEKPSRSSGTKMVEKSEKSLPEEDRALDVATTQVILCLLPPYHTLTTCYS